MKTFIKIFSVLDLRERTGVYFVFAFSLLSTLVELLSIGILFPFIYFLTNPTNVSNSQYLSFLARYTDNLDPNETIYFGLFAIIFIFLIKTILVILINYKNLTITNHITYVLTSKLFKTYLTNSYLFHLGNNSAKLLRNVITEINYLGDYLFFSILLMSEFLLVLFLFIVLLYLEPVGISIMIVILTLVSLIYSFFFKERIFRWGATRQQNDEIKLKSINQGLSAIKEIKLYRLENFFLEKHDISNKNTLDATLKLSTLSFSIRPIFEFTAIFCLSILLFLIVINSQSLFEIQNSLALIAVIGASSVRLIPAFSSINTKLQMLKYVKPAINVVYDDLISFDKNERKNFFYEKGKFEQKLEIKNINFSYPNTDIKALKDINISINKNEILGIKGKSGAGKSTLIDIILGLLSPDSGEIFFDKKDILNNLNEWQNLIGYVPQHSYLLDDTIRNNILFGIEASKENEVKIKEVIHLAQLNELVMSLPEGLDSLIGERGNKLSGGQRQRIALARALFRDTSILLFDEATSSLDQETESEIINSIKNLKGNKTIIIVAHKLSFEKICDRMIEISDGELINTVIF